MNAMVRWCWAEPEPDNISNFLNVPFVLSLFSILNIDGMADFVNLLNFEETCYNMGLLGWIWVQGRRFVSSDRTLRSVCSVQNCPEPSIFIFMAKGSKFATLTKQDEVF